MLISLREKNYRLLIQQVADGCYLFVLGLYLLYLLNTITMSRILFSPAAETFFWIAALVVGYFRILVNLRTIYWRKSALIACLLALPFLASYFSVGYSFLLMLFLLMIGGMGVDAKKVFHLYLVLVSFAFVVTVIGGMSGAFQELVYMAERDGGTFVYRSSLGFVYPTDCAAILLYWGLVLWVTKSKLPSWVISIYSLLSIVFVWRICNARNTAVILAALLVMSLYVAVAENKRELAVFRVISKLIGYLCAIAFPVGGILIYVASLVLGNSPKYGHLFSYRFQLSLRAIEEYGLSLLGTAFEQIGAGGTTLVQSSYNFVDSGVLLIMLRYGILVFLALSAGMALVCIKCTRRGYYRIPFALGCVAMHSLLEHHMPELNYNIFLLLPFFVIKGKRNSKSEAYPMDVKVLGEWLKSRKPAWLINWGFVIGGILALVVASPWWISLIRTMVSINNWKWSSLRSRGYVWFIFLLLLVIWLVWNALRLAILHLVYHRKPKVKAVISMVLGCVGFLAMGCYVGMRVHSCKLEMEPVLSRDEAFFEVAEKLQADTDDSHKVYVVDFPLAYGWYSSAISYTVWNAENMVRKENVTLVVKAGTKISNLLDRGFVLVQINPEQMAYTNDYELVCLLAKEGYSIVDYQPNIVKIDLEYLAHINGVEYDEEEQVAIIRTGEIDLGHGPYISLDDGYYLVNMEVALMGNEIAIDGDTEVATLVARGKVDGQEVELATQRIVIEDFEEESKVCKKFVFSCENASEQEFLVISASNVDFVVRQMEIYEAPSPSTVLTSLDQHGWVVREDYIAEYMDGYPEQTGVATKTYAYDSIGRLIEEATYDSTGELALSAEGYVRKVYVYDDEYYAGYITYDEQDHVVHAEMLDDYLFLEILSNHMKQENALILLSVRDEATWALSSAARDYIKQLGLEALSQIADRDSYIGVIEGGQIVYDLCDHGEVPIEYFTADSHIGVWSGGMESGNMSSIIVDGAECSKATRGINMVVVDKDTYEVLGSYDFDTYAYTPRIPTE